MDVGVNVTRGVGLRVGSGVSVGNSVGILSVGKGVAELFTAAAVSAITVGRYSGG